MYYFIICTCVRVFSQALIVQRSNVLLHFVHMCANLLVLISKPSHHIFNLSPADVELIVSEVASKISLRIFADNLTETDILESLDYIPPTMNQYVLVACETTCIVQLLAQVAILHI